MTIDHLNKKLQRDVLRLEAEKQELLGVLQELIAEYDACIDAAVKAGAFIDGNWLIEKARSTVLTILNKHKETK